MPVRTKLRHYARLQGIPFQAVVTQSSNVPRSRTETTPRPLRVAVACSYYRSETGGGELHAALLAGKLARELGRCDVVTTQDSSRIGSAPGVRVVRAGSAGGPLRRLRHFLSGFLFFLRHGTGWDVVHGQCLCAFVIGALAGARFRGCRTALRVCTDGLELAKLEGHVVGRCLLRISRVHDAYVVPSAQAGSTLAARGVDSERIHVIANGLSHHIEGIEGSGDKAALRRRLGLSERPLVLYAGRLESAKGTDTLLRAWPLVGGGAQLVLLGRGPDESGLRAALQRMADDVRVLAPVEDPVPFYRAADVFVFPSRSEGFGNALAEAMACGTAVVTTRTGLACEHVQHGDNGLLFDAGDAAGLAHCLRALLDDPERREHIAARGRETALREFATGRMTCRYLELYRALSRDRALEGSSSHA